MVWCIIKVTVVYWNSLVFQVARRCFERVFAYWRLHTLQFPAFAMVFEPRKLTIHLSFWNYFRPKKVLQNQIVLQIDLCSLHGPFLPLFFLGCLEYCSSTWNARSHSPIYGERSKINRTNPLTKSTHWSPSWETNTFPAGQEIPRILWNLSVNKGKQIDYET